MLRHRQFQDHPPTQKRTSIAKILEVKSENQADARVCEVAYESQADLRIFKVAHAEQAGWRTLGHALKGKLA